MTEAETEFDKEFDTGIPATEKLDNRWLFNFDLLWLEFEANLRGGKLQRNPTTGNWKIIVPKGVQPFMNEKGIKDIMAILRANVNVIGGSSVYEEDRILAWCERLGADLNDLLYTNKELYGIEDGKEGVILSTFMQNYESNLRKALNGKALILSMQGERVLKTETHDSTPKVSWLRQAIG